jgi:hypothetical protein
LLTRSSNGMSLKWTAGMPWSHPVPSYWFAARIASVHFSVAARTWTGV